MTTQAIKTAIESRKELAQIMRWEAFTITQRVFCVATVILTAVMLVTLFK